MKKAFLTLAVVILLSVNVFAQYKPFQFGLNITPGVNLTKINSDNIDNGSSFVTFNWGFKGNIYFVENYGLSTGFNILNVKGGYSYTDKNEDIFNSKIHNQYLEIPLSLIMRTEKIGNLRIFGNVGYGLGISLNSKQENIDPKNEIIETSEDFKKIRHGLIIKLGTEYNVYKASCISLALVYNNNFVNIYKKSNPLERNVFLNQLCLEIGFMF